MRTDKTTSHSTKAAKNAAKVAGYEIKNEIRAALAGTTAQNPMDTDSIIKKTRRQRRRVEAALMELYQALEVGCCKIINGREYVVWWIVGNSMTAPISYREQPRRTDKVVRRISPLSAEVRDLITATPGISMPDLIVTLGKPRSETQKIMNSVTSLLGSGRIRAEGVKRHYRYFPGEQE